MDFIADAKALATMPVPGPGAPDDMVKAFDAMPIAELASAWCALQHVNMRDETAGTSMAKQYFDHLPHDAPGRALDLVLAVLRSETDKSILMQLNNRLMTALLYNHGTGLIDRIESEARDNARLRWLIGGTHWWGPDDPLKARLRQIADIAGWGADEEARDTPAQPIDYEALTVPDLARAWIEQTVKLEKDRDDNWYALSNYEYELQDNDPDRAIDMILEVLKIETNPMILSVLSAGPLENIVSEQTIDRIEREAAADPRFLALLQGVWYSRKPEDVQARLNALLGRETRAIDTNVDP